MAVSDIEIMNPNVNSGATVNLGGGAVVYAWKNLVKTNVVPVKYDIGEVTFGGFENPKITITGAIPIDESIANHISQSLLVDFATVKSGDTTLAITAGKTGGTNLKGRPTGGYETDGAQTLTSSIKVQVESFNISFSARESREGEMWTYTLNLVETA